MTLAARPFKDIKKKFSIQRPECLHCKAPIDPKRNRHGWLHDSCEAANVEGIKKRPVQ